MIGDLILREREGGWGWMSLYINGGEEGARKEGDLRVDYVKGRQ